MPLFYQQDINETTRLGIWKIEEPEAFFLQSVPLQRNITHPLSRLQHLAGRFLLLVLFPDFPHEEIEIADTRKPFLPDEMYHFSISHCGHYAAAIVSNKERVGIDVELIGPRVDKVKHKFLHTTELAFVNAQDTNQQIALLTTLWSAKEAMYKWWGRGDLSFGESLRTFPFLLENTGLINAQFSKENREISLQLDYQIRNDISLVWLHTDAGIF